MNGRQRWPRVLGFAVLGLIGGVLAGIIVNDILASALISGRGEASADKEVPTLVLVLSSLALPCGGILGVVIGIIGALKLPRRKDGNLDRG